MFSLSDKVIFARLDHVYNRMRMFQAKSNSGPTPCIGSGNCCKVGLQVHMVECAYIANHIQDEYYKIAEHSGTQSADDYINGIIDDLTKAMYQEEWEPNVGVLENDYCVFYKDGCSIYDSRPGVCRTFGTTTPVDGFCPRKRNEDGSISVVGGERVEATIKDFLQIIDDFEELHEDGRVVVYMPLGVLRYLLSDEQMLELRDDTADKFWTGCDTYNVKFVNDYR